MSTISTTSRRSVAVAFVAVMFVSAACGTRTEVKDVGTPVQAPAPGAVQHAPMSADAAERQAQKFAKERHTPTSADAAERRSRQKQSTPSSADAAERHAQDPRLRD